MTNKEVRIRESGNRGGPLSGYDEAVKEKKVVVPAGETVILPRPPRGTVTMIYTIEGDEESRVKIRDLEGHVGAGFVLAPLSSPTRSFSGPLAAIGPMEAENISGCDAWIIATFE
jgi:hypothetical protein